jgi:hypothetical protein
VRELEENLRALLRDMVCGHIDANVTGIADDLLPPEKDARSRDVSDPPEPTFVVRRSREATTDTLMGLDDAPGLFTRTESQRVTRRDTEQPTEESVPVPAKGDAEPSGESEDWGLDDDAADYSAAV